MAAAFGSIARVRRTTVSDYSDYYAATYDYHHRHAFLLTRDVHKADDLVQHAFLQLYVHWSRVNRQGPPRAWMNRTITNRFLDGVKSAYTRHELPSEELPHAATEQRLAEEVVDHVHLAELLDLLSPLDRAAVVARYLLDYSVREVGDMLGYQERQMRRILTRALTRMRLGGERDHG